MPKLHKTPYKEGYIAGSSTCSTKELYIHLTNILSAVNKGNNKITEQSYKGKVKTHKYVNRQNQSTTGKLGKP